MHNKHTPQYPRKTKVAFQYRKYISSLFFFLLFSLPFFHYFSLHILYYMHICMCMCNFLLPYPKMFSITNVFIHVHCFTIYFLALKHERHKFCYFFVGQINFVTFSPLTIFFGFFFCFLFHYFVLLVESFEHTHK